MVPYVLAVLAAALLFGTTGTAQALGPDSATPLALGVMRMVFGGTGLALIAFTLAARMSRRRVDAAPRPRLGARPLSLMLLTGVCLALYQPLFFLGTERNGVAIGTVIALGSAPILAGLLEWALTRRMPSFTWVSATVLATVGVAMLGVGGESGTVGTDPAGLASSVAAGACFAVIANSQRTLLDAGWDPFTVVGAMGASSAALSVLCVPFVDLEWLRTPSGLFMALWVGLAAISVAYVLFTWGLSGLTAATAATLTLGEPLTATILGITVLGEQLSPLAIVGLMILTGGLALLAWGSRTQRDPGPYAVEG
ncbi:DMT family transporter [Microbacterium sp. NPDC076911]|uniref:DMT family transporter n=1 Tax=Microbacterium sp. NPDC076911 TaxID=3154958 RepID=UPI00343E81A5